METYQDKKDLVEDIISSIHVDYDNLTRTEISFIEEVHLFSKEEEKKLYDLFAEVRKKLEEIKKMAQAKIEEIENAEEDTFKNPEIDYDQDGDVESIVK